MANGSTTLQLLYVVDILDECGLRRAFSTCALAARMKTEYFVYDYLVAFINVAKILVIV